MTKLVCIYIYIHTYIHMHIFICIHIYMYIDIWQVVEHTYVLQIGDYHNEYAEWRPIPKTQRQSIREQISAAAIGSSSGQLCETCSGQSHEVVVVAVVECQDG